ncbi:hypothetical protein L195_g013813 [Trifolium pratense]|uniref:Uncharacterized protein n=1 Tax=Trifolium pratense TaxID=57577 RepID=A0A2K3PP59_TRIPR|nr:hypothetical protein L195_g013813 [Trifolium pratense]
MVTDECEEEVSDDDDGVNSQSGDDGKIVSDNENQNLSGEKDESANKEVQASQGIQEKYCCWSYKGLEQLRLLLPRKVLQKKEVPASDSEYDVDPDVQDIMPYAKKKTAGKKIPSNVSEAPMDNKTRFESLIKALSEEDADGNLDGDEEEGNEVEGNATTGGDNDEDTEGNVDI